MEAGAAQAVHEAPTPISGAPQRRQKTWSLIRYLRRVAVWIDPPDTPRESLLRAPTGDTPVCPRFLRPHGGHPRVPPISSTPRGTPPCAPISLTPRGTPPCAPELLDPPAAGSEC